VVVEPGIGKVAIVKNDVIGPGAEVTQVSVPGLNSTSPATVWSGADGNIYISSGNGTIAQITPDLKVHGGTITTPAGATPTKANPLWTIPTPSGATGPPSALNFTSGADGDQLELARSRAIASVAWSDCALPGILRRRAPSWTRLAGEVDRRAALIRFQVRALSNIQMPRRQARCMIGAAAPAPSLRLHTPP
jgi:hypothetical protein